MTAKDGDTIRYVRLPMTASRASVHVIEFSNGVRLVKKAAIQNFPNLRKIEFLDDETGLEEGAVCLCPHLGAASNKEIEKRTIKNKIKKVVFDPLKLRAECTGEKVLHINDQIVFPGTYSGQFFDVVVFHKTILRVYESSFINCDITRFPFLRGY